MHLSKIQYAFELIVLTLGVFSLFPNIIIDLGIPIRKSSHYGISIVNYLCCKLLNQA